MQTTGGDPGPIPMTLIAMPSTLWLLFFALVSYLFIVPRPAYGRPTQTLALEPDQRPLLTVKPYRFISAAQDTVAAELGTFKVPENRIGAKRDSITLSFIRFKSTNPHPASPIVYLAGGPGGSGSGAARQERFELFMKLREVADVIAYDQRGTGLSNQLPECPCKLAIPIATPVAKPVYVAKTKENLRQCKAFWDAAQVDLTAYSTTQNAQDIDDLRQALGVAKISLWGISYGSHLGFECIRLFEDRLDKVVLASLEGPDELLRLPLDTEHFLEQLCQRAATNYGQGPQYPHLLRTVRAVHRRLKRQPVIAPVQGPDGQPTPVGISEFELQVAVTAFYLKDPSASKALPKLYTHMQAGDFSGIAPTILAVKQALSEPENPMTFAMDMHSGASTTRKKRVAAQLKGSTLGEGINFLLLEWLEQFPSLQLPDSFRTLKDNQVDALLLSGTMDGRTYLSSAVETAKAFKKGQLVVLDNAGHNLYMQSPLIGDMVLDFFKGKPLNLCEIKLKPTVFD